MICGIGVKIVISKQVKNVTLRYTHKLITKESYTDVTNVVIKHIESVHLTNTFMKMYTKMAEMH